MWAALRHGHAGLAALTEECSKRVPLAVSCNAFTHLMPSGEPDTPGALSGLPIAVKANIAVRGAPLDAGSRILQGELRTVCDRWSEGGCVCAAASTTQPAPPPPLAPYHATAVSRLTRKGVGARVIGLTNMDEWGMGSSSDSGVAGPVRNPLFHAGAAAVQSGDAHDHRNPRGSDGPPPSAATAVAASRDGVGVTAGGSSGGSAAAVAAGAVVAALGTDTGGSVRQPAAFCGVVGWKPSYGRIPRWGLVAYASSLDTVGVVARTVDDVALMGDIMAGWDGRDDTALRQPRWRCEGDGVPAVQEPLSPPPWNHRVLDATIGQAVAAGRSVQWAESYAVWRHPPYSPALVPTAAPPSVAEWARDSSALLADLRGVRVGIPRECHVAELPPLARDAWQHGAAVLSRLGAQVVGVSLPRLPHAVAAYYVLACAEAASNLARYDGIRYGRRGVVNGDASTAAAASASPAGPAAALHALITATRTQGFGDEAKRRVMMGNLVLSTAGRSRYYDSASQCRQAVTADMHAAFRPRQPGCPVAAATPLWRWAEARSARGAAAADVGVDVLLMPTAPVQPWRLGHDGSATHTDPAARYMVDVMTVGASLARLPALSLPVHVPPTSTATNPAGTGLQLVGRFGDEDTVLRVGAALEGAARG